MHRTDFPVWALALLLLGACSKSTPPSTPSAPPESSTLPDSITITGLAQNPEGIEFDERDQTFLLSSLNAGPIIKVQADGTANAFTSGEDFPLSTAGLEVDQSRGRLLVAGFNGTELLDEDPATKGTAHLRVYDLDTGALDIDVPLAPLLPDALAYFANDIAVDAEGNAYVSDWYAGVVYKVDVAGQPSVFWTNTLVVPGGPNGLDVHPDGYLLVSVLNDGTYSEHALVRVPLDDPAAASEVEVSGTAFSGFDGMVVTDAGVVGVTNDGAQLGGNVLMELVSADGWSTAEVAGSIGMPASTTVAVTPDRAYYVIEQDFSDPMATEWTIQRVSIP